MAGYVQRSVAKRKYPTVHVPGTMGKSAPIDTTGIPPEMQETLGAAPPDTTAARPRRKLTAFEQLMKFFRGGKGQ